MLTKHPSVHWYFRAGGSCELHQAIADLIKRGWHGSLWRMGRSMVKDLCRWCRRTSATVTLRRRSCTEGKTRISWYKFRWSSIYSLKTYLDCTLVPFSVKVLSRGEMDAKYGSWTLIWLDTLPRNTSVIYNKFTTCQSHKGLKCVFRHQQQRLCWQKNTVYETVHHRGVTSRGKN